MSNDRLPRRAQWPAAACLLAVLLLTLLFVVLGGCAGGPATPAAGEAAAPAADETATDETATDETATDETATDETATDEAATPAADETTTDEAAAGEAATDEAATDEAATDEAATGEAAAPAAGEAAPAAAAGPEAACDASSPSLFVGWGIDPQNEIDFGDIGTKFSASAQATLSLTSLVTADISQIGTANLNSQLNGATIGFLTAHGLTTALDTGGGGQVRYADLELGMCDSSHDSPLRYLLLSSCNTLAHGPRRCSAPVLSANNREEFYACPGEWSFGPDSEQMGNIYERWGPRLGNSLRMVCGATTQVTPENAQEFWGVYRKPGVSLADAFLDALSYDAYVGLCMARGSRPFTESALVADKAFTTTSNPFDDKPPAEVYYHLQYSRPFADPYAPIHGVLDGSKQITDTLQNLLRLSNAAPSCAPVLSVTGVAADERQIMTDDELTDAIAGLQEFNSEAEALRGEDEIDVNTREEQYVGIAAETLQGREPPFTVRPQYAQGVHLLLSTFPADPALQDAGALRVTEKSVILRFPVFVRLDETPAERLDQEKFRSQFGQFSEMMSGIYEGQTNAVYQEGEQPLLPLLDGTATMRLTPKFVPFAYSYSAPVIDFAQAPPSLTTISPYDAFLQALRITYGIDTDQVLEVISAQYGDLEAQPLQLHTWSWGYTHWHNGKYIPEALFLTYEFEFTPNAQADYSAAEYPPRRVRVDGQIDETCQ